MNKKIDLSNLGGFPATEYTLDFMQSGYNDSIQGIAMLAGDAVIVSGMAQRNNLVDDGWIVWKGELLPFKGGVKQSTFIVDEVVENRKFRDDVTRPVYFTRLARFAAGGFDFDSLKRLSDIKSFQENTIQSETALNTRLNKIEKILKPLMGYQVGDQQVYGSWLFWGRPADEIPAGWEPVPDDEWKGRVPVVLDASQEDFNKVGKTGGEYKHALTIEELPQLQFEYSVPVAEPGGEGVDGNQYHWVEQKRKTNVLGGGKAHSIVQPYKVIMFIRFVG